MVERGWVLEGHANREKSVQNRFGRVDIKDSSPRALAEDVSDLARQHVWGDNRFPRCFGNIEERGGLSGMVVIE